MKANIEMEIEVKMGKADLAGTGLAGYMPDGTTYKQLVKVFGKPQHGVASPDGKVQVEWTGRINGLDFSIYDYKNDCKPQANTEWHIGGRGKMLVSLLTTYFNASK
ncbi:MAG: hypothetical protein GYA36_20150 [Veillonellaceae bacterium]|nr:hypothetical protein [Veillonellaceae bacterium]